VKVIEKNIFVAQLKNKKKRGLFRPALLTNCSTQLKQTIYFISLGVSFKKDAGFNQLVACTF